MLDCRVNEYVESLRRKSMPAANHKLLMFLICFVSFISIHITAQTDRADIMQLKFYYDSFEFDKVISAGNAALKSGRQLTPDELEFLHQYMALSFYNTAQLDSARAHFLSLLSLDPDRELDPVNISPKIIDFFNEIKKDYQALAASSPQTAFTKYVFVEDLRPGAAWRSAVIPGWGQFYKQQKAKGYLLGGAFWGSLIATGVAWLKEDQAHQDYLNSSATADIENNYSTYNQWYKTRRTLMVTTAVLWAVTVGDAMWSPYARPSLAFQPDGGFVFAFQLRF